MLQVINFYSLHSLKLLIFKDSKAPTASLTRLQET